MVTGDTLHASHGKHSCLTHIAKFVASDYGNFSSQEIVSMLVDTIHVHHLHRFCFQPCPYHTHLQPELPFEAPISKPTNGSHLLVMVAFPGVALTSPCGVYAIQRQIPIPLLGQVKLRLFVMGIAHGGRSACNRRSIPSFKL